jgi:hypothetical protein
MFGNISFCILLFGFSNPPPGAAICLRIIGHWVSNIGYSLRDYAGGFTSEPPRLLRRGCRDEQVPE